MSDENQQQNPINTDPLEKPWEHVRLSLYYQDGQKVQKKTIELNRAEVEEEERQNQPEESRDEYEFTSDQFMGRIMYNAQQMATQPLRLQGDAPNKIRILPPWAVREVEIEVNRGTQHIVIPNA